VLIITYFTCHLLLITVSHKYSIATSGKQVELIAVDNALSLSLQSAVHWTMCENYWLVARCCQLSSLYWDALYFALLYLGLECILTQYVTLIASYFYLLTIRVDERFYSIATTELENRIEAKIKVIVPKTVYYMWKKLGYVFNLYGNPFETKAVAYTRMKSNNVNVPYSTSPNK